MNNAKKKKILALTAVVVAVLLTSLATFALTSDVFNNQPDMSNLISVADSISARSMSVAGVSTYSAGDPTYISPSDISISGNDGYVADETGGKVYKINLSTGAKTATEVDIGQKINAVYTNGTNVFVLYGELNGKVKRFDMNLANPSSEVSVGHTPSAAIIGGASSRLYVANRYSDTISAINTNTMAIVDTIRVTREPFAMTFSGNRLFVAHHLQDGKANADKVAGTVTVINTATNTIEKPIPLVNGSESLKGICTSPDGKNVYVTHLLARSGYPTSQLDRGWINTNAMSIINNADTNPVYDTTVLLDDVDLGAGNPWGIECPNASTIIVSSSGTQEALIIDRTKMHQRIAAPASTDNAINNRKGGRTYSTKADIPNYLDFMSGLITRVKLPADATNPREMAISGTKAYFANYISGNISVVDFSNNYATSSISLGIQPAFDPVRRGEELWGDATYCYQQWESCASCHPDARIDSINWDNLNDGLGNPKSARSMLYSHRKPPTMSTGIRESAERAVRAGMQFIQFNTLSEEDMSAIDEYLKSLRPVQSPHLNADGSLSTSVDIDGIFGNATGNAVAGKALFAANCASCHSGPLFTDLTHHSSDLVPSDYGWEITKGVKYVTPTIVEVWRTGPWGINGAYSTMKELMDADTKLAGKTQQERNDLAAYVLSVGNEGETYGVEMLKIVDPNDNTTTSNHLFAGGTIKSISFRRQLETDKDATATFKLYDNSGNEIVAATKSIELTADLSDRTAVVLDMNNYVVPTGLTKGVAYYEITIVEKDTTNPLATPFVVKCS